MPQVQTIHCVYASTSGNVEMVVELAAQLLQDKGYKVVLQRAEKTPLDVIAHHQVFLLATSTWEHGELNPFFVSLLQQMKTLDCSNKVAAFIGLGDRRYEPVLFCEGVEKVKRVWLQQGGQELGETLKIQGEPYAMAKTLVTPWVERLTQLLVTTVPVTPQAPVHSRPTFSPYA